MSNTDSIKLDERLIVVSSPHFHAKTTTRNIMLDVLIALTPTLIAATVIFGTRALFLSLFCVACCVVFEYLYRRVLKLSSTVGDLSAAVTGLILAFNLPATLPLWMAAIGCFVAVVIVKQLFGGLGKNFANPAIVARIVLLVSFTTPMTHWLVPQIISPDVITGATPLALLDAAHGYAGELPSYMSLFMGTIGGSLGETCKLTLLLGGIYLMFRRVISATIPLVYMAGTALLCWILGVDPLYHLLAGGLILGAFFCATDYVTSPTTEKGKIIFALGCAVFTVLIRLYAGYPEGVSFAILIMNIIAPHIDRLCNHKALGGAGK